MYMDTCSWLTILCGFAGPFVSISCGKVIKKFRFQDSCPLVMSQILRQSAKESIFSISPLSTIINFMRNCVSYWLICIKLECQVLKGRDLLYLVYILFQYPAQG